MLLIIGSLVYVCVMRGRLLGASIHVHAGQFPELFAVVDRVAAKLGVAVPQIFVRDDMFVPVAPLGTGEPYALVFSNYYIEHFTDAWCRPPSLVAPRRRPDMLPFRHLATCPTLSQRARALYATRPGDPSQARAARQGQHNTHPRCMRRPRDVVTAQSADKASSARSFGCDFKFKRRLASATFSATCKCDF
ncbi:MAG: hypothetical protein ACLPYS_06295 [Vulcanimicrobiaceae bacterium]